MKAIGSRLIDLIKNHTTIRFLIVGIINTLVGTGTMFLLYNCVPWNVPVGSNFPYWFSTAANYVVGSIVSFLLNKYFTFRSKSWSWSEVFRFVLNIALCYLVAYGLAKPLVRQALSGAEKTIQDNAAMLVGMVLFVFLNYFGQRFFAFKNKDQN